MIWHSSTATDIVAALDSDMEKGLTDEVVQQKLKKISLLKNEKKPLFSDFWSK